MKLTAGDVARLTGGALERGPADRLLHRVSIDSRTLEPGDLFFAIRGPNHDGHAFVDEALARGAAGAVVSATVVGAEGILVRVQDTTRALQELARKVRASSPLKVVAITGSMGKTTTKEAAAAAVGVRYRVLKSKGNLNNLYGLPLSILALADEEAAVLELGMSAPGEIARLTDIARPDVGVLTNVAEVHLEFFDSLSAIADAKGELFSGLWDTAIAVVNADDPLVLRQARRFAGRKIRFGLDETADVFARDIRTTDRGLSLVVGSGGESVGIVSPLFGRHNVYNLIAGLAAAQALQVPFKDAARALEQVRPARHRGERVHLGSGALLIDETYNSNPRALRCALEALVEEEAKRRGAVVGDMLELGERAEELHIEAGEKAASSGLDFLIGVGPLGGLVVEGARGAGMEESRLFAASGVDEAARILKERLRDGDVVLLKASRSVGLERAFELLGEKDEAPA